MRPATNILVLLGAVAACGRAAPSRAPVWKDTVVSVNGTAITSDDLAQVKAPAHDAAAAVDPVDELITEELAAQRARELGLDQDPSYQEDLHRMEAPVRAFERQRLAELYTKSLAKQVKVDDAEARAYYDAHAAAIGTELHVEQIIAKDRASIDADAAAIAGGADFEEVAHAHFPVMPAGRAPWDLGWLRWNQLPAAWNGVVDGLAVGATSGVIAGPRGRFWIIHVVERRAAERASFEDERDVITGLVTEERVAELEASTAADLRARARIERSR